MRAAITSTLLKSLPAGNVDVRDTRLKGFVLRCRASGAHSYSVEYGRGKKLTLGSVYALKPAEAREEATKVLGDAARGIDPLAVRREAKAHTWNSYLSEVYEPWLSSKPRGAETLTRLRANFFDLDKLKLTAISAWHVEKWRAARLKAGTKPATVNRDINDLKAALTRAVAWNHLAAHPLAKLKPLKTDRRPKVRYLSAEEQQRLVGALKRRDERIKAERETANQWRRARGYAELRDLRGQRFADHLEPLVLVSLNTGLRRGEVFGLRWCDVNLSGRLLTVAGETSKSQQTRHVPLNDHAFAVLVAWRNQTQGESRVFPGAEGRALNNVKKSWLKLLSDARITGLRWHDLRHDFASKLVMAGVSLAVVRELLGHASADMVLRYAHLSAEHKASAVQKLCAVSSGS